MAGSARVVAAFLLLSMVACLPAGVKQPIRKPTYDPAVPAADLFDAIDAETVETTVIAKDAHTVNLFVTNKSDAPVSVKLPDVVTAVQVLKQFGAGGFGMGNGAGMGMGMGMGAGGLGAGGGGGFGQSQPLGGTANSFGPGGTGLGSKPGNGLWTIPSARTIQVPLRTVCLAHGKPEPHAKMQYKLVRLEDYTSNPELQCALREFASGRIDIDVTQAVVWHLVDGRSWTSLAGERNAQAGPSLGEPLFTSEQLAAAQHVAERIRTEATSGRAGFRREVSAR